MKRKVISEINSGSMADIAFLLLIFFLVTTTIDTDSGLFKKLPPYTDEIPVTPPVKARNVFEVLVNANNEIMVEGEPIDISTLKEKTIEFLINPGDQENLPEFTTKNIAPFGDISVTKGIISLQNDRGTSYETYLWVINELTAAGNVVKDNFSMHQYNKKFDELDRSKQGAVRLAKPCIISEAEPVDL